MKQNVQLTPIKNGILIGMGGLEPIRSHDGQILRSGIQPEITFVGSYEELCNELKFLFEPTAIS
jgi:hypothetical protein